MRQLAGGGPAALAALVPSLPDASLPGAEAAARSLRPADRAAALLALRATLATDRLDAEILAAARATRERATSVLVDWAAGAPPHARGPVLLEAVHAADDWERASLLAMAVRLAELGDLAALLAECPRVAGDELPEVLAAFAARADGLPADVRAGVLDLVGRPRGRAARAVREAAALQFLDAPGRERCGGRRDDGVGRRGPGRIVVARDHHRVAPVGLPGADFGASEPPELVEALRPVGGAIRGGDSPRLSGCTRR